MELFVEYINSSYGYSLDRTNAEVHVLLGSIFPYIKVNDFPVVLSTVRQVESTISVNGIPLESEIEQ